MSLNFDNHQFEGRGSYPVNATNGIAYDDYTRMHTKTHTTGREMWVPPFALNNGQLQKVLLFRAWRIVHHGLPFPENVNRDEINKEATAKALAGHRINRDAPPIQFEMQEKHKTAIRKAGGYLELAAAIAFRSWRLGMNSVEVAASLNTTPHAVRVSLWRLRALAKQLGYETGRAGHTAGKIRKPKRPCYSCAKTLPQVDVARALSLLKDGHSRVEIAKALGVSISRLKRALPKYEPRWPKLSTTVARMRIAGKQWNEIEAEIKYDARSAYTLLYRNRRRLMAGLKEFEKRHLATIEKLAAENGGKIPHRNWLYKNGFARPCNYISKNPILFSHLQQREDCSQNTFSLSRAIKLYEAGISVPDIAFSFGYQRGHGNNRVRRALIKAGVYKNKKPGHGGPAVAESFAGSVSNNESGHHPVA